MVGLLVIGTFLSQSAHARSTDVSFKNNTHQEIQLTWIWSEGKSQKTLGDPVTLSLTSDNSAQKKEISPPNAVQYLLKDASPFILKGTLGTITTSLQKGFVVGLNKNGSQYTFTYAN